MIRTVAAAAIILAATPAAAARLVDYALDDTAAHAAAAEAGLALTPLPSRGTIDFGLDVAPGVDHDVLNGAKLCSAFAVRNPLAAFVRQAVAGADRDGSVPTADDPAVTVGIRLGRAATLTRCVLTGEMVTKCLTRVTLSGTILRHGAAAPFHVVVDEAANVGGFCGGLARGIGLVSRTAVAKLIALATEPASPAPMGAPDPSPAAPAGVAGAKPAE